MELSFFSAELRDVCEKRSEASAELGYATATELARVLADIDASDIYADFDLLFRSQIFDLPDSEKCFQMKTGKIHFRSGHPKNLGATPALTDWPTVTRIMITAIETSDA